MISSFVTWIRGRFDACAASVGTFVVVGVPCAVAAVVGVLQSMSLTSGSDGRPLPIELYRLEVSWTAARFASFVHADGCCRGAIRSSFVTYDAVFPLTYAAALSAIFLWAERWRRVRADGTSKAPAETTRLGDFLLVAVWIAAFCDTFIENLSLWAAMPGVPPVGPPQSGWVSPLVLIGSTGAAVKWALLLCVVLGTFAELLSGPRGEILKRSRFSVLALVLSTVPFLAIPQGKDILQRMFEGDHPILRLLSAVLAPASTALVVWYCARKLTELRFVRQRWLNIDRDWFDFFGEQIPRILGTALIGLIGVAFALVGQAEARFLPAAVICGLAAVFIQRKQPPWLLSIGRRLRHIVVPSSGPVNLPALDAQFATLIVVTVIAGGVARFKPERLSDAAFVCLVGAWIFHVFVHYRRVALKLPKPVVAAMSNPLSDRGVRRALVIGLVSSVAIFALFTWAPVYVGRAFGPLWVLAATVSNAVFFGSITVWVGQRIRVPIVTVALAVAALFSLWNDNHAVRLVTTNTGSRGTVTERLDRWLARQPLPETGTEQQPQPVFLVAAAGGGLRAAYWTAMSLARIQDEVPSFAQHTFAFSGVSGGSLGGALFDALVADAADHRLKCGQPDAGQFAHCVHDFMHDDFLSPVLAKMVAPDFLQWFLPFPVRRFDRSIGLERSWEASYEAAAGTPTFERPFIELTDRADAGIPVVIFNSTHVETGRRYLTTSAVANAGATKAHRFLDARDVLDEVNTGAPAAPVDMRLSTAVHNSARFTYVSPAGRLDSGDGHEHGRVVDGGYFENSGLATLREIFDVLRKRTDVVPWILYLCNDPKPCAHDLDSDAADVIASGSADEVLSPVRALLKTRDARGGLARASIDALTHNQFWQLNVCDTLPSDAAPPADRKPGSAAPSAPDQVVDPPLGWVLSNRAQRWMDDSLDGKSAYSLDSCYGKNKAVLAAISQLLK